MFENRLRSLRFFSDFNNGFLNDASKVVKSRHQKFRPQSFEMSSHTSFSDHCSSFRLFICQSSVFEDSQTFITHSSKLHMTFGNCVLKTGRIRFREHNLAAAGGDCKFFGEGNPHKVVWNKH